MEKKNISIGGVAEFSKIGLAGVFAGVFCILFAVIYTLVHHANRKE